MSEGSDRPDGVDGSAEALDSPSSEDSSNSFQDCLEAVDEDVAALTAGVEKLEVAPDFSLANLSQHFDECLAGEGLSLAKYLDGYREVYKFLTLLGTVFTWVASDVAAKISTLDTYNTGDKKENFQNIKGMIDYEVKENVILSKKRDDPSGSRTLLRLHRALDFVVLFLDKVDGLAFEDKCAPVARDAYDSTLSQHHIWPVRKGAGLAMNLLPTKAGLMHKVNPESASNPDLVKQIEADFLAAVASMRKVFQATQVYYEENDLLSLP